MNQGRRQPLICRLCAKEEKYLIDVFSDDGKKQELERKIRLCLPITVTVDDKLPRQVCLDCLNKLDAAFDLYTGCIEAQQYIKMKLAKNCGPSPVVARNSALQSGFSYGNSSSTGRSANTTSDNSLRNLLGLQQNFSSYVGVEQKRLQEQSVQRMIDSQKAFGVQYGQNAGQYVNGMSGHMSSSANSQLLGVQLDGAGIVINAPNIPILHAGNSPATGNLQGQLFVSPASSALSPAVSIASPSVPAMAGQQNLPASHQFVSRSSLPSSVTVMPVSQLHASASDTASPHFAPSPGVFRGQPAPQDRAAMSRTAANSAQLQQTMSGDLAFARLLGETRSTAPVVTSASPTGPPAGSSRLFAHVPLPPVSMATGRHATQMQPPADQLQNPFSGNLLQQTDKSGGNALGSPQCTSAPDLPTYRMAIQNSLSMGREAASATMPLQPVITQISSGVEPMQDVTEHLDLSNDTDDDMDREPDDSDPSQVENMKPFSLATAPSAMKRVQRKRGSNSSLAMESCPHCHKDFRADIIFHHIKLHFRQSFSSCLDCGRNYSSDKALEAHKCPGEVA